MGFNGSSTTKGLCDFVIPELKCTPEKKKERKKEMHTKSQLTQNSLKITKILLLGKSNHSISCYYYY